jgi:predicted DCC family thiol-disulfide oxidoreductase YuxK
MDGNKTQKSDKVVLIYDGNCPICSGTVAWIKGHERKDSIEVLTCQSDIIKKRYPFIEEAACMKAMQLVLPDGGMLAGEKALPEIVKRLERYHFAAALFKLPGANIIARRFYRWFADRRYPIAKVLFPDKRSGMHHDDKGNTNS